MQPTAQAVGGQVGKEQAPEGRKSSSHATLLAGGARVFQTDPRLKKGTDILATHVFLLMRLMP